MDACVSCGLPNYEGLCPVCRGDEPGYRDELQWAFGPWSPADHEAREGERRYETWLESLKDHGP